MLCKPRAAVWRTRGPPAHTGKALDGAGPPPHLRTTQTLQPSGAATAAGARWVAALPSAPGLDPWIHFCHAAPPAQLQPRGRGFDAGCVCAVAATASAPLPLDPGAAFQGAGARGQPRTNRTGGPTGAEIQQYRGRKTQSVSHFV